MRGWLFVGLLIPAPAWALELCGNAFDDDGDSLADCADPECGLDPLCCGAAADFNGDGWCGPIDVCPLRNDPGQADTDLDGTGDACDVCPGPADGLSLFTPVAQIVARPNSYAGDLHLADLDDDGDLDLAYSLSNDDLIAWVENLGAGGFGAEVAIATGADEVSAFTLADLDGDGDADLVAAESRGDAVSWFERVGPGQFGPRQVVAAALDGANDVVAADLDGDGDSDLVVSVGDDDRFAWVENLGGGTFGQAQDLGSATIPSHVEAGDLDGDGDVDVLTSAF